MNKELPHSFFARDTRTVAKELIGCFLVRQQVNSTVREKIIETEAYHGPSDRASHAFKGITKRNTPMFGPPGTIYVYMIYGMYHCLNISTVRKDFPAAVLIRATENASGPGKVCQLFQINRSTTGKKIGKKEGIWIENKDRKEKIYAAQRIGVDYAAEWVLKKWRYRSSPLT